MINVVVVSHGDLADALIRSARMIAGEFSGVYGVALFPGETPEVFGARLSAQLDALAGQDTLVFIDLFGGTPYNVAARLLLRPGIECLTGVNLPMLLEVVMSREATESVSGLTANIAQQGKESIINLGPLLKKPRQSG
jgi:mannose/fructose/sorbose-specific phosphotransferase system IIA component